MIVQTASEALARYQDFLARDALVQSSWHIEKDGRQLACALGVLGDNLNGVRDCPAQVMPRWLAQHVVWFFDGQNIDDAKDWGARFYAELARVNGNVPFSVVHDWQANFVCPLAIEVAEKRTRDTAPHAAVQELHKRALAGDLAGKEEWVAKLRLAYADTNAYADAYADTNAYADAYADTNAYAYANADANAYADAYANANADANADAYADTNAYAYAYADTNAYAYAYADADAYANANADADAYADAYAYQRAVKRLADGMIECMSRLVA